jgi:hypothetical protein
MKKEAIAVIKPKLLTAMTKTKTDPSGFFEMTYG